MIAYVNYNESRNQRKKKSARMFRWKITAINRNNTYGYWYPSQNNTEYVCYIYRNRMKFTHNFFVNDFWNSIENDTDENHNATNDGQGYTGIHINSLA